MKNKFIGVYTLEGTTKRQILFDGVFTKNEAEIKFIRLQVPKKSLSLFEKSYLILRTMNGDYVLDRRPFEVENVCAVKHSDIVFEIKLEGVVLLQDNGFEVYLEPVIKSDETVRIQALMMTECNNGTAGFKHNNQNKEKV